MQGPGEPEVDGGSVFSADPTTCCWKVYIFYGDSDDEEDEGLLGPSGDNTFDFAATFHSNELAGLKK